MVIVLLNIVISSSTSYYKVWDLSNSKSLSPTYTNLDDLLIDYAAYADSPILSCRGQILQPRRLLIYKHDSDSVFAFNLIADEYPNPNANIVFW